MPHGEAMDEFDLNREPELSEEVRVKLQERQTELIKIIESFEKLDQSKEWNTLKELVFDKSLEAIERQLLNESLAPKINTDKLYKLQGEWVWAKQYNDTNRFVEALKLQLQDIKKRLK